MSNRTAIHWAIADCVSDALAEGRKLDVTVAALRLSTEFPQSGYTIDEICEMIGDTALSYEKAHLAKPPRQKQTEV